MVKDYKKAKQQTSLYIKLSSFFLTWSMQAVQSSSVRPASSQSRSLFSSINELQKNNSYSCEHDVNDKLNERYLCGCLNRSINHVHNGH